MKRYVNEEPERVVLVGVEKQESKIDELLAELKRLADTAGVTVVGKLTQKKSKPDARYYIGSGKVEELKALATSLNADTVVFNVPLSASQERNLESALELKVVDYTEIILDIFAQHAKTREGNIQVELAQSSFRLTRLTGHGVDMSRLGGGIGTRGPGETKLEHDRRKIRKRISELKGEIEKLSKERSLRREKRKKSDLPLISLIGYTNSGKSTLLNSLTNAGVLSQDKLFATLDTTTRRFRLSNGKKILLTDTVGFITNLPHQLIAAFRATLEEVTDADLLLHVVDVSNPYYEDQIAAVYTVLEELNCVTKPIITVFNKVDRLKKKLPEAMLKKYKPSVAISALNSKYLDDLQDQIVRFFVQPLEQ
jgi:GTPase